MNLKLTFLINIPELGPGTQCQILTILMYCDQSNIQQPFKRILSFDQLTSITFVYICSKALAMSKTASLAK